MSKNAPTPRHHQFYLRARKNTKFCHRNTKASPVLFKSTQKHQPWMVTSHTPKGGLAGVLVMLLTIVVYVFFKRRNCTVRFEDSVPPLDHEIV
ncbi:hypothetical protein NC652_029136 [Populus alba x Populus x berolinensis]|nr:hypothetical protein NC652_029136 [Populus alba x Populus x berolinensis]